MFNSRLLLALPGLQKLANSQIIVAAESTADHQIVVTSFDGNVHHLIASSLSGEETGEFTLKVSKE